MVDRRSGPADQGGAEQAGVLNVDPDTMPGIAAARAGRTASTMARGPAKGLTAVVLVVVLAGTALFAGPALMDLAGLPGELDRGRGSARHYNAAMERVVRLEDVVVAELGALDGASASVARVGPDVARLDVQLRSVAERVEADTQGPLAGSAAAVQRLVGSLRATRGPDLGVGCARRRGGGRHHGGPPRPRRPAGRHPAPGRGCGPGSAGE